MTIFGHVITVGEVLLVILIGLSAFNTLLAFCGQVNAAFQRRELRYVIETLASEVRHNTAVQK